MQAMSFSSPLDDLAVAALLLDMIGESIIRSQELALGVHIASGRAQRDNLLREMYGIEPNAEEERS